MRLGRRRNNALDKVLNGLVAAWDFNETSGIRRDEVGGEDLNPAWGALPHAAGVNGNGLDATEDNARVGVILSKRSHIGRGSYSLSYWFKLTTFSAGNYNLPPAVQGGNGAMWTYEGGGTNLGVTLETGRWYHFVTIYDSSANKFYHYINGVKRIANGITPNAAGTPKADSILAFGSYNYSPLCYFDEARLYNRVLTQTEINALYNNGAGNEYRGSAMPAHQETFKAPVAVAQSNIEAAIEGLGAGQTYEVPDGIHGVNVTLNIPAGVTVRAAEGARPIIVSTTGYAPQIVLNGGCTLDGIWIGGTVGTAYNEPPQSVMSYGGANTIRNCTIWGSFNGLNDGPPTLGPNLYTNNRFINNGGNGLNHHLYVTYKPEGPYDTVSDNILIGSAGGGYQLHFYHDPTNLTITGNFMGDGWNGPLALTGTGHVCTRNIIWSHRYGRGGGFVLFGSGLTVTMTDNLCYGGSSEGGIGGVPETGVTGNYFARSQGNMVFGADKTLLTEAELEAALDIDALKINNAIDNLRRTFFCTPAEIYANTSIEGWFTTIRDLMTKWNTYTA